MKRYSFEKGAKNVQNKTMKKETTCKFEIPMSTCSSASRGFWSLSMSLGKILQRAACSITWRCDSSESRPSATSKCLPIQQVKEITNDHYQNRKSLLLDSWTWSAGWLLSTILMCWIPMLHPQHLCHNPDSLRKDKWSAPFGILLQATEEISPNIAQSTANVVNAIKPWHRDPSHGHVTNMALINDNIFDSSVYIKMIQTSNSNVAVSDWIYKLSTRNTV